jgi:hypothetical protein
VSEFSDVMPLINAGGVLAFAWMVLRAIDKASTQLGERIDAWGEKCDKLHDAILEMKAYRRARTDPGSLPPRSEP